MFNDDDDYLFLVLIEKIVICSYMIAQFLLTVTGTLKHKPIDASEGKEETKLNPLGTLYLPISTRNVKT